MIVLCRPVYNVSFYLNFLSSRSVKFQVLKLVFFFSELVNKLFGISSDTVSSKQLAAFVVQR